MEEMSRLLGKQGGKLGDLPGNKGARRAKLKPKDELEDEDSFPKTVADDEPPTLQNPIEIAVSKLTEIAGQLAAQKKKEGSLEALLDGGGSGSAEGISSGGAAARNAAALRALKESVGQRPEELVKILERNLEADFNTQTCLPGSSTVPVSCRAWLELRSKIQNYPSTIWASFKCS